MAAGFVWDAEKIKELRLAYGESQEVFRRRFRITVDAYRLWEQNRGSPGGPAQEVLVRLEEELREGRRRPVPELQTA